MKQFILIFLFVPKVLFSQDQQRTLLVYNVGLGAITSGIGAVINKPKHTNWKKYFIKGCWQGSIGGLVNYTSKKALYLVNKKNEPLYSWPAKLLHAAGLSIIENASLNEPFLQNWNIDYGPVRLDFSINGKRKTRVRFIPETTIAGIIYASKKGRFNLGRTLSTGNLVFVSKDDYISNNGVYTPGSSFGRAIVLSRFGNMSNEVIAHEIVHQFQSGDFQVLNTWLKPFEKKIKSKTLQTIYTRYVYFNIPWFWPVYEAAGRYDNPHYYKNFFEFEAQRFAANRHVNR
jgi:hypothetical protein